MIDLAGRLLPGGRPAFVGVGMCGRRVSPAPAPCRGYLSNETLPGPIFSLEDVVTRSNRFAGRTRCIAFLGMSLGSCGPGSSDAIVAERDVETAFTRADALQLENLEGTVETLHEKFTALAAAMPEDRLGWAPMEDVRTVEEIYIHIAADNWWVPAMMGWEAPPETGVTEDSETFTAYQAQSMTRDEMLAALDASFVFFRESMAESAGDLDRDVSLRGTPAKVGDIWIRAVVHLHEHLGQSIAYARANEVVPPWSR